MNPERTTPIAQTAPVSPIAQTAPTVVPTTPTTTHGSKLESWASGIMIALCFPFTDHIHSYTISPAECHQRLFCNIWYSCRRYSLYHFSHQGKIVRVDRSSSVIYRHLLCIVLLASSALSGNFMGSFFGQGFEYSTAAFLIILCFATLLSAIFSSRSSSRALSIYTAVLGSFVLLAIFQAVKLVDSSALSFGLFVGATGTPIGSWYDLGIFSGIVFILSGLAFLYFPMSRIFKWIVVGTLLPSLFSFLLSSVYHQYGSASLLFFLL